MRKIILFVTALMAAATTNAQVVLWNGENQEVGSNGGFWDRADPTVVEEGDNKFLQITLKENPGGWADEHRMAALPLGGANLKGLRRISMKIKMSENHNVMVKLTKEGEGGYTGDETRRWFWYDAVNGWQKMIYEYSVGPNSENITDEGNTLLEIYPYEFEDKWGSVIYIDDIQLEGPMINDYAARTLADDSQSGNVVVTGSLSKGTYQCTWDGDWHPVDYDDYNVLQSKLAVNGTSVDLRDAAVSDGDGPQLRTTNPNRLIFAPAAFYDNDNVVVGGNATKVVLNDDYPFATPEGFNATAVEVERSLSAGNNYSFVFPFWVNADEIDGSAKMAEYTSISDNTVNFTTVTGIDANTPFIMTGITENKDKLTFGSAEYPKSFVATPANSMGTTFVGVYSQTSGNGKYGIAPSDNKFHKGGEGATVKPFRAYLESPSSAHSLDFTIDGDQEGDVTSIDHVVSMPTVATEAYTLSGTKVSGQLKKGIYIINSKKVVVK